MNITELSYRDLGVFWKDPLSPRERKFKEHKRRLMVDMQYQIDWDFVNYTPLEFTSINIGAS